MKIFNPVYLVVALMGIQTTTASLFGSDGTKDINLWTRDDLEQFLYDRGLTYNKQSKTDELKKLAANEWTKLKSSGSSWANIKQKVLDGSQNVVSGNTIGAYDPSYKDWIFESWSKKDLYKFIHKNNIQFNKDQYSRVLSNKELVDIIKDNWDHVIEKNKNKYSGYYPGDWLFEYWTTASLKDWLKEHDIDYSFTDTRLTLLKKVRENIYTVSVNDYLRSNYGWLKENVATSSDSLLSYLSEASKEASKKASKKYKDYQVDSNSAPVFENWSLDDLRLWLKENKVSAEGSAKDLATRGYKLYLEKKGKADKYYYKINKDAQTKAQLKAQEARLKSKGFGKDVSRYIFDLLSIADLKLWLRQHKKSTEGAVGDLYERAVEAYEGLYKDTNKKKHFYSKKAEKKKNVAQNAAEDYASAASDTAEQYYDAASGTAEQYYDAATDVATDYYDAANEYFSDWSVEGLKEWLKEHKQSTEGSAEELRDRSVSTFSKKYSELALNINSKQAQAAKSYNSAVTTAENWWRAFYLKTYHLTYGWVYRVKSFIYGEKAAAHEKSRTVYFITPNDNWLTRLYKQTAVNFRHYVLGEQIFV